MDRALNDAAAPDEALWTHAGIKSFGSGAELA